MRGAERERNEKEQGAKEMKRSRGGKKYEEEEEKAGKEGAGEEK